VEKHLSGDPVIRRATDAILLRVGNDFDEHKIIRLGYDTVRRARLQKWYLIVGIIRVSVIETGPKKGNL